MARRPRSEVIDESTVGIYHVFSRCVRREFLCGFDWTSGRDFSYRRGWITDRFQFLAGSFAIDACSFAVLSNHYHLLIRNRPDIAAEWSDREIALRWWRISAEGQEHGAPSELDLRSLIDSERGWAENMRKRLASPSWFMGMLNEDIAKRANAEDELEGHFWQDRFGARRVESDLDVLAVSLYIDLNEIRAQLADRPEDARYSSVFRRLGRLLQEEQAMQQDRPVESDRYSPGDPDFWLSPIDETVTAPPQSVLAEYGLDEDEDAGRSEDEAQIEDEAQDEDDRRSENEDQGENEDTAVGHEESAETGKSKPTSAPCRSNSSDSHGARRPRCGFLTVDLKKYFELLELVGRNVAPGKSGRIDPDLPPLLERLGINQDHWNAAAENAQQRLDRLLAPSNFQASANRTTDSAAPQRPRTALE